MLNIIYCCDNDYLEWTGISMASVVENNKDEEITFYLATEGEEHPKYQKLLDFYRNNKKINIKYLDCMTYDGLFNELNVNRWGANSYYVYRKLISFSLLDCDYAWYIDSDILCLDKIEGPKINRTIGSVIDSAHAAYQEAAGIDKNAYFYNSGMYYVDVKKWKDNKCTERMIDYLKENRSWLKMADQDLQSIVLQDDTEVIDPKFNYYCGYDYYGIEKSFKLYSLDKKPFYSKDELYKAKDNVVFYHCVKGVFGRPWEKDNYSPAKDKFEKYRDISAFKDYQTERKITTIDKFEMICEKLPDFLYIPIHNLAQLIYVKKVMK